MIQASGSSGSSGIFDRFFRRRNTTKYHKDTLRRIHRATQNDFSDLTTKPSPTKRTTSQPDTASYDNSYEYEYEYNYIYKYVYNHIFTCLPSTINQTTTNHLDYHQPS